MEIGTEVRTSGKSLEELAAEAGGSGSIKSELALLCHDARAATFRATVAIDDGTPDEEYARIDAEQFDKQKAFKVALERATGLTWEQIREGVEG